MLENSTPSLSAPTESTPREFPNENWIRKSLPGQKRLEFFTSSTKLHKLIHPGETIKSLNLTLISYDITVVIQSSPMCMAARRGI